MIMINNIHLQLDIWPNIFQSAKSIKNIIKIT